MNAAAIDREALRQRMLVRALWHDARSAVVAGWLREPARARRGLQAYQANAGALAERALAAACPTVQALVGAESFAALARALWHAAPPERGDVGEWGAALAGFVEHDPQLAEVPYLADVARLDWAVHAAERAADAEPPAAAAVLQALAAADPATTTIALAPGTAVLVSRWPVVAIRAAHEAVGGADDPRFDAARAALAAGRGECALVRRRGWRAEVVAIDAAEARFTQALLRRQPLAVALDEAGPGFAFATWLPAALEAGAVASI